MDIPNKCICVYFTGVHRRPTGKESTKQGMQVQPPAWEDPLETETATHSSLFVWDIPWTEEPGGLQFTESQSQTQLSN